MNAFFSSLFSFYFIFFIYFFFLHFTRVYLFVIDDAESVSQIEIFNIALRA